MKMIKKLQYFAVVLMASTTLSTTVSAMGMLVAMGTPVAQNVVQELAVSAENRASNIEPASGCSAGHKKHPHETREYNQ